MSARQTLQMERGCVTRPPVKATKYALGIATHMKRLKFWCVQKTVAVDSVRCHKIAESPGVGHKVTLVVGVANDP